MAVTGKDGAVKIGSDTVAEITNWSLDLGGDDIDNTNFSSQGRKEFIAGLSEWSGSFEGAFDSTDTNGQKALISSWASGTPVSLILQVSAGVTFSGSALVKPSIEVPVDDKVTFSCDFQGTGELTVPS